MHGLIRVRQFTISEGHLVLRPDQLEEESAGCLTWVLPRHRRLLDKCTFRFLPVGSREPEQVRGHEGAVGSRPERDGAHPQGPDVDYTIGIDEAAFYGPKLDIQYKNVYGKEEPRHHPDRHVARRALPACTTSTKTARRSCRTSSTALSRLLRAHARLPHRGVCRRAADVDGAEQVRFLPVTDRAADYCAEQAKKLEDGASAPRSITATRRLAARSATRRPRSSPYMVIVGDRDMENGTVSPRHRADGDLFGAMSVDEFSVLLKRVVDNKEQK